MLHLRVGEHLVDGIDRAARHAGFVQAFDPIGAAAAGEITVDFDIERVAVLRARRAVGVVRILQERGRRDGLAEPFPDRLPGGGDVDIAVVGLVDAGRCAGRMIVAGLLGDFTLHQITGGLKVEHENLRLQERGGDLLALFGFLALQ